MKHIARVQKFFISLLLVACLIPNLAFLTLIEVGADNQFDPEEEIELITPDVVVEPATLPAFSATVGNTTYSGVATTNRDINKPGSDYQEYINPLVDALLHMVRWETLDNSDYSQLSCYIDYDTPVSVSGNFDAVYDALYGLLLQMDTGYSLSNSDENASLSQVTRIWRVESENVTISRQTTISGTGRLIIIASGATNITLPSGKQLIARYKTDDYTTGGTVALLGRKNAPINLQAEYDAENETWLSRNSDAIQVTGGSLYLRYTNLQRFKYSTNYTATIVLPSGDDTTRYVYMSRSSLHDVEAMESPGIFCKAYDDEEDENTPNSALYIYESDFYNCWVRMNGSPSLGGGAIRSYAADRSNLYVRKCDFYDNVAGYRNTAANPKKPTKTAGSYQGASKTNSGGGAIYWKSAKGHAELIGCTFRNNISTALGGAVYNTGDMTIQGCTFENNLCYGYGGAIAVEPPNTSSPYDSITKDDGQNNLEGSLSLDSSSVISGNTAKKDGGGIYFNAVFSKIGSVEISTYEMLLEIKGAQILNNSAVNGGGVAINLNYQGYSYENGVTIEAGSQIIGNTASGNGGAIWVNAANGCLCKMSTGVEMMGGLLQGNTAANGGAIYINAPDAEMDTMKFVMSDGTVYSNGATKSGGAVYIASGTLSVSGGTIYENQATQNGGVAYLGGGTMTISGGEIYQNRAVNGAAGYIALGTLNVTGGKIYQHTTATNGGVAYLGGGGTLNVSGGEIYENAAANGGVFYMYDGEMNISQGQIYQNTATENGGVAYLGGGTMTVSGGEIYENTAANGGVGYLEKGTLNVSGGKIYNHTQAINGGAFYLLDGEMNISGGEIYANTATENGGAFYLFDGEMYIYEGKIYQNAATQYGGAAYLGGGSLTVWGGEIYGNSAVDGGSFYIKGGDLGVNDGEIYANTASNDGGAAFVSGGSAYVNGGTISENIAQNVGGAIAINNGNYAMKGGAVNGNRAETGKGGAIYIASSGADVNVNVLSGSICNNYSGADGGAIAVVGADDGQSGEGAQQTISVTIGVNKEHSYDVDNQNYPNVDVECDHDGDGQTEVNGCPVINGNSSAVTGGGIFISGGQKTQLLIHCLIEDANVAADGQGTSNFMMVEGGRVLVDTRQPDGDAINYGFVVMESSIHIESGDVDVYGGMSNPLIESDIVIDIINENEREDFDDSREEDGLFFKIQYYENFENTGRYKVLSAKRGETIVISGSMYTHDGYEILEWNTEKDQSGDTYSVIIEYTFGKDQHDGKNYIETNLILYAIWKPNAYFVIFSPNALPGDKTYEPMQPQALNYGKEAKLNACTIIYPGYSFVGWLNTRNGMIYSDVAAVLNLSNQDGDEIEFLAQWEKCYHDGSYTAYIVTESGSGGILTRTCPCRGYSETATLAVPEGAVFAPEQTHEATYTWEPSYAAIGIYRASPVWDTLTITYEGTRLGNEADAKPINAGTYKAYLVDTSRQGVNTYLSFYVDKAQQPLMPEKPTYQATGSSNDNLNVITVNEAVNDTTGKVIEYQLQWYEGDVLKESDWGDVMVFELPVSHTNYFVFARYAEEDNYYASVSIRADAVYYYKNGLVAIFWEYDYYMINCRWEEVAIGSETIGGLMLYVEAKPGYYLTNDFRVYIKESEFSDTIEIEQQVSKARYLIYNLPTVSAEVTIVVEGAKIKVAPVGKVDAGENFGTNLSNSANISRDSAYTSYFEIANFDEEAYSEMRLTFSSDLPVGTTLILFDRSAGTLWYYVVDSEGVSTVYLEDFVRMGNTVQDDYFVVSGENLKYQFIVSFAYVAEGSLISSEIKTLQTTLQATPTNVPELNVSVNVALNDVPLFSVTVKNAADHLEKTLEIQYAATEDGVVASKWNSYGGALVLEVEGGVKLPDDAYLKVVDGTGEVSYYRNAQGNFVIPIAKLGKTTLQMFLASKSFPNEAKTYTLQATLYTSRSNAAGAPMNGDGQRLQSVKVIYQKDADAQPSLKATGTQTVVSTDQVLTVYVDYQGVPVGSKVTVELWGKDVRTGLYSNTMVPMSDPEDESYYTVDSFKGLANNQSYCLMFFVKDSSGKTLLKVPYYFILHDLQ